MSNYLLQIFSNRNIILVLALSLGLFWGQGVEWTEMLVIPAIGFVMVLSTITVDGSLFKIPNRWLKPATTGIFMNYIILGGLIVILSKLLPLKEAFKTGYIILASVPPAVGIIPFTSILGGDIEFSLIGCLSCYFGAFLFIPIMFSTFLGQSFENQQGLFTTLIQLILIPLIVSRLLRYINLANRIKPVIGSLTNWSFFIVIYTVVGINREAFFSDPSSLITAVVLTILTTYLFGYIIKKISQKLLYDSKKIISIILLGTSKNAGFAAGIALSQFGKQTAIPITIQTVIMLSYIIYLDITKIKT